MHEHMCIHNFKWRNLYLVSKQGAVESCEVASIPWSCTGVAVLNIFAFGIHHEHHERNLCFVHHGFVHDVNGGNMPANVWIMYITIRKFRGWLIFKENCHDLGSSIGELRTRILVANTHLTVAHADNSCWDAGLSFRTFLLLQSPTSPLAAATGCTW